MWYIGLFVGIVLAIIVYLEWRKRVYIYEICETRFFVFCRTRYVGQSRNPWRRYREHMREHSPLGEWMRHEIKSGRKPRLRIVGLVRAGRADHAEACRIASYPPKQLFNRTHPRC